MRGYFLVIFSIFSLSSFSQISKDWWLLGGDASFSYSQSREFKIYNLQLSPAAGYFLANNLAGGLRLNNGFETFHYSSGGKERQTVISVAPFLRYYFLPVEKKVNLFADAAYGFVWGTERNFSTPQPYNYRYSTVSFMAGPAIFLNHHTALEVTLSYVHSTRGAIDTTATNTLQLGIGFQIHIGKSK